MSVHGAILLDGASGLETPVADMETERSRTGSHTYASRGYAKKLTQMFAAAAFGFMAYDAIVPDTPEATPPQYDFSVTKDNLAKVTASIKEGTIPCDTQAAVLPEDAYLGIPKATLDWARDPALTLAYRHEPERIVTYYKDAIKAKDALCAGGATKGCPEQLVENIRELHKAYTPSAAYLEWDNAARTRLFKMVNDDPALSYARRSWNTSAPDQLSLETKMIIMQTYLQYVTRAYSDGSFQPQQNVLRIRTKMEEGAGAFYHQTQRKIEFSMKDMENLDFENTFFRLAHEARHGIQHSLALFSKTEAGQKYVQEKGLDLEATIFASQLFGRTGQSGFYITAKDGGMQQYHANPVEMEAYRTGADYQMLGAGLSPQELTRLSAQTIAATTPAKPIPGAKPDGNAAKPATCKLQGPAALSP